ncbi:glutamine synthetase family protein [Candidatus Bipolaricaulota bacterium]|nr:glutamine synthetase family protein [Candidatus Bipolaricaulota bacterium]
MKEEGIKFVQLWFTDLLGNLKSVEITAGELEGALEEGVGFDGSSIHGFARIDESDMVVRPDPKTFAVLPWGNVARLICDVYEPSGEPYQGDPRWALKQALNRAADMGFTMYVGPEVEYFYFRSPAAPEVLDRGGYFDLVPPDEGTELRRETVLALEGMGIPVEATHHEVAPSQHEIDLRFADALTMADSLMTTKYLVKEIARRHGLHATFMPKPLYGENGSGMHTHQSLFHQDGRNAFFDPEDPMYLSQVAKGYIAGIMRHAREIIGVCAQWVNSYKRLVPGYEAPVYITWARRNRSNMIRVPMYKPGKEAATRIEFRAPDPACNPYLAFAVMLHAGLEGIQQGYPLPEPVERDVFAMSPEERRAWGIQELPGALNEAIAEMEASELVRRALGDHIFAKFIENKRIEWDLYRAQVHRYELDRYLAVL